jgi:hypothetical protein
MESPIFALSMTLSENRFPLFEVMLSARAGGFEMAFQLRGPKIPQDLRRPPESRMADAKTVLSERWFNQDAQRRGSSGALSSNNEGH